MYCTLFLDGFWAKQFSKANGSLVNFGKWVFVLKVDCYQFRTVTIYAYLEVWFMKLLFRNNTSLRNFPSTCWQNSHNLMSPKFSRTSNRFSFFELQKINQSQFWPVSFGIVCPQQLVWKGSGRSHNPWNRPIERALSAHFLFHHRWKKPTTKGTVELKDSRKQGMEIDAIWKNPETSPLCHHMVVMCSPGFWGVSTLTTGTLNNFKLPRDEIGC